MEQIPDAKLGLLERSIICPNLLLLYEKVKMMEITIIVITLNSLSTLQVCLEDDYLIGGSEELCRNHYIKMEG